ncbi:exodeoxyribonuclease VII small subunit [Clostridium sp. JN-9]|uniref:exodeoxyribonuclease VII small subunit n=1 Tax=Clostridium sp. JN-9 TaxID=2507159 RepID=UPI000FFE187E|nr:exodeoxyribonuclease VII small subunit [Clostridium sp. JN-9]QAT40059.1 exodeoxyribonuclease VII small subunit [Clostridium sp. JN-9]
MPKKVESYEEMMKRLESIVNKMDGSELSLSEAMKNYEEGIKLCNLLYKTLNEAEEKIKILTDQGEQNFTSEK